MLHKQLEAYLHMIEDTLQYLEFVSIERYEEEILTPYRVNLRIRIRFRNGHLLELNEALVIKAQQIHHLGYRYHFQDVENITVFRYDDTPHFPALQSFPHHKHVFEEALASQRPSIPAVIEEAKSFASADKPSP